MHIGSGVAHGLFAGLALGLISPALSAYAHGTLPPAIILAHQTEDDEEALHTEPRVASARERADDRPTESAESGPAADEALRERLDREEERLRGDREKIERRLEDDKERDKKKAKRKGERKERRRSRGRDEAGAEASGVAAESPSRE